jgi:hypothetical protein
MLTLEERVNGGRYESWFGARPPHQPRAQYQRPLSAEESPIRAAGIRLGCVIGNGLGGIGC